MKIERAVLRELPMRLRSPFVTAAGERQERRVLLVTLEAEGVVSWSECVALDDPSYSGETTDSAWGVLTRHLLPAVVGSRPDDPATDILDPVRWVRGNRMAKAAIEMAGWDLAARARGVSLATLLGGVRRTIPVGVSVGLHPDDTALYRAVQGYVDEGYARVKVKVEPGRDVEMLRGLRQRFPDLDLMVDANAAYTLADLDRLRDLDELGLLMIEQPLDPDDLFDHARLQWELDTPICLDESIRSDADAELALELGACRIINIKPGRVGGLGEARAIHDRMRAADLPVWCGGMLESGVGRAYNAALASLPGFTLPADLSASRRYWERDIVSPEFEVAGGEMVVPSGTGIGVEVDVERIEAETVRRAVFTA